MFWEVEEDSLYNMDREEDIYTHMQVIVYTCVLNVVVAGMKLSSTRPRLPRVNTFSLTRAHTMLSPHNCISSALVGLHGEFVCSVDSQIQNGPKQVSLDRAILEGAS